MREMYRESGPFSTAISAEKGKDFVYSFWLRNKGVDRCKSSLLTEDKETIKKRSFNLLYHREINTFTSEKVIGRWAGDGWVVVGFALPTKLPLPRLEAVSRNRVAALHVIFSFLVLYFQHVSAVSIGYHSLSCHISSYRSILLHYTPVHVFSKISRPVDMYSDLSAKSHDTSAIMYSGLNSIHF